LPLQPRNRRRQTDVLRLLDQGGDDLRQGHATLAGLLLKLPVDLAGDFNGLAHNASG
jgi:hypothetical protein